MIDGKVPFGNNTQRPIQSTDRCPLPGHGNHTWGECRANRYGNNNQGNQPQGQGNHYLSSLFI